MSLYDFGLYIFPTSYKMLWFTLLFTELPLIATEQPVLEDSRMHDLGNDLAISTQRMEVGSCLQFFFTFFWSGTYVSMY